MTGAFSGEMILYQFDDGEPALEVRLDTETATCRKSRQVSREIPFHELEGAYLGTIKRTQREIKGKR